MRDESKNDGELSPGNSEVRGRLPELYYGERRMSLGLVNRTLDSLSSSLKYNQSGEVLLVKLEPGDGTRYNIQIAYFERPAKLLVIYREAYVIVSPENDVCDFEELSANEWTQIVIHWFVQCLLKRMELIL